MGQRNDIVIMTLLEWRVGSLQSAAKPHKGISDGAGGTRLFIRLREHYHYRHLKKQRSSA